MWGKQAYLQFIKYAFHPWRRYSRAASAGFVAFIIPRPTIIMSLPLSAITCKHQFFHKSPVLFSRHNHCTKSHNNNIVLYFRPLIILKFVPPLKGVSNLVEYNLFLRQNLSYKKLFLFTAMPTLQMTHSYNNIYTSKYMCLVVFLNLIHPV